jgi:hypothetical protein
MCAIFEGSRQFGIAAGEQGKVESIGQNENVLTLVKSMVSVSPMTHADCKALVFTKNRNVNSLRIGSNDSPL